MRTCGCHRCTNRRDNTRELLVRLHLQKFKWVPRFMILCPECGNKRCPKASDHRLACTGSNDTGQEGSVYR